MLFRSADEAAIILPTHVDPDLCEPVTKIGRREPSDTDTIHLSASNHDENQPCGLAAKYFEKLNVK